MSAVPTFQTVLHLDGISAVQVELGVFVDSASPMIAMFIVGSLARFTGSLIHSIQSARGAGRSVSVVPAD